MEILYNIVILILFVLSFLGGKWISDSYNRTTIEELRHQLRTAEIERGIGYIAPVQQQRKYMPIGQPFMDRLKENGKAVQHFTPSDLK